jgi:Glycosyl transferase family 11
MARSKYSPRSEIERPLNVFATFRRDASETRASSKTAPTNNLPVLTMSSLGQLGRFGNQIFQYAFLRICANESGAMVECPPWIGQKLFGHADAPISRRLRPAIERGEFVESLFDLIPEFVPYLETLAELESSRIGSEALRNAPQNVHLWGFFQLPTHLLKPHREFFCSLFEPVPEVRAPLDRALESIHSKAKTIVGIHVRRGDFITEPRTGFALVFPAKWYREWLESVWQELDQPLLYVCSDDLDTVLPEFQSFSPVTWRDLQLNLPEGLGDLAFYIDFFILSRCEVVCISNSTFSFAACMLNTNGSIFIRPHWDLSSRFTPFDPWNSQPVLWFGGTKAKFLKSSWNVLRLTYRTQGFAAVLKSIFYYLPKSHLKVFALRIYLAYQMKGVVGVGKSILCTLGWRSLWEKRR